MESSAPAIFIGIEIRIMKTGHKITKKKMKYQNFENKWQLGKIVEVCQVEDKGEADINIT